jgi:hypothetical protein
MTMVDSSRHRDQSYVTGGPVYPDFSMPLSAAGSRLIYPASVGGAKVGVAYDMRQSNPGTVVATPIAPGGASLFNTISSYKVVAAPGVGAQYRSRPSAPPEVTLTGALPSSGLLCTIELGIEGIWPMSGEITCGGSSSPAFNRWLRSTLEPFGDPIELSILQLLLAQHAPSLGVLTYSVERGAEPAAVYLSAQGISTLIGACFSVVGGVATFRGPLPDVPSTYSFQRTVTATFDRTIELAVA